MVGRAGFEPATSGLKEHTVLKIKYHSITYTANFVVCEIVC